MARKNSKKIAVALEVGSYDSFDGVMDNQAMNVVYHAQELDLSEVSDYADEQRLNEFDVGDFDTPLLSDDELDEQAESLEGFDAARIAQVMASIDMIEETNVASSSTIDHHTQSSSWAGVEKAEQIVLEQAVEAEIALLEGPASTESVEAQATDVDQAPSFASVISSFNDEQVVHCVVEIANELDLRAANELIKAEEKGVENPNIQGTIKKARAQMVTKRAARVLLAVKADPVFINREINSGSSYGVYAIGKLGDMIKGLTEGAITNAINLACMKSLFAFRAAGAKFDMEAAKGAASRQYGLTKVDVNVRKHLISHTVATGTASTQASSTMQALETLGVVTRSHQGKNPTFTLTSNPIVGKLEEIFGASRAA